MKRHRGQRKVGWFLLMALALLPLVRIYAVTEATVQIISPTNGTWFRAPGLVPVTAVVTRPVGQGSTSIRLEFYEGATLFGSDTNQFFNTVWQTTVLWPSRSGTNFNLTAVARDNFVIAATSSVVRVAVNVGPTVSIVSPTNSQVLLLRSNMLIKASAVDVDGSVTNLQFFSDGNLLGQIANPQSSETFAWTNLTSGAHQLTARAQDDVGVISTSAPVSITVNFLPTVQVVSPTNGTVFPSQSPVQITARASDSNGEVTNLQVFVNGNGVGTTNGSSGSFHWTNVSEGIYDLSAQATDNLGETGTSAVSRITVLNAAPTVIVTSPADGSEWLAGSDVVMVVGAVDPDGQVDRVEASQMFGGNTITQPMARGGDSNTWTVTWTNLAAGRHEFGASATDNQGRAGGAVAVTVSLLNARLVSPTNDAAFLVGTTVEGLVELAAGVGSATVELFEGSNLLERFPIPPTSFFWTNAVLGDYAFRVWATNDLGLATTSAPVHVMILDRPLLTSLPFQTNYRSGLLEQVVRLSNPTPSNMGPVRVWIFDVPAGMQVFNATGVSNGVAFVQYALPIVAGEIAELTIEYYVPSRTPPAQGPRLVVESADPVPPPEVTGEATDIEPRVKPSDGKWVLEWSSLVNRTYYVRYRRSLSNDWITVVPSVLGSGNRVQWVDTGPPRTVTLPEKDGQRFYQVILVP